MISSNRASTSSRGHESRMAFWLISRPEVATPPALLALPGANRTAATFKAFHGLRSGRHVGAFCDADYAVFNQGGSILFVQFILRRARQSDIHRHMPGANVGQ